LPEGWEWRKLGEICEKPQYGYTTSAKLDGSGPQFLRTTDISEGEINWQSVPYCLEVPIDEEKYKLVEGDILVARAGSVGASVVIKKPPRAVFASYLIRLRPKGDFYPFYLGLFLRSNVFWAQLGGRTSGTTLPGVNATNLSKIKIPLPFKNGKPDLEKLQKIAAILKKAEQTRRLHAQGEELIDELLISVFYDMFGDPGINPMKWKVVKINDVVEYSQYGTSKKSNNKGKGFPLIGMSNVTYDGKLDLSNYSYVDIQKEEFQKLKLHKGDIIFNRTNSKELVGKTTYWNIEMDAVIASYLVRLKLKDYLNPIFFSFLLNQSYFKKLFLIKCKKAVNQSNISPTRLKQFEIFIPPIELQDEFAKIEIRMDNIRKELDSSKQETETLFNALLQKAFTGELIA